jgi:hypothetical protein
MPAFFVDQCELNLSALKKNFVLALGSVSFVVFVLSCKHEALDTGAASGGSGGGTGGTTVTCSPDTVYFQQQVLPLFISNCTEGACHNTNSGNNPPKGVVLTSYSNIVTTGDVRAGQPDDSKVFKMITETNPLKRMPKGQPALPSAQIGVIRKWIEQGAKNNSCIASECDTATVTFSGQIKTTICNKCLGCHSGTVAQGAIDYSTYAGVKAKVTDGRLWGAINHLPGFSPMPKGGTKLSDCEIKQFKKWIDAAAPNN